MNQMILCLSFLSLMILSSVVWTEESSDEDLDYFAALDVVAAEASPRVMDAEVFPGPSAGRRWRRAVAKSE
jgi:hypothetical protein